MKKVPECQSRCFWDRKQLLSQQRADCGWKLQSTGSRAASLSPQWFTVIVTFRYAVLCQHLQICALSDGGWSLIKAHSRERSNSFSSSRTMSPSSTFLSYQTWLGSVGFLELVKDFSTSLSSTRPIRWIHCNNSFNSKVKSRVTKCWAGALQSPVRDLTSSKSGLGVELWHHNTAKCPGRNNKSHGACKAFIWVWLWVWERICERAHGKQCVLRFCISTCQKMIWLWPGSKIIWI